MQTTCFECQEDKDCAEELIDSGKIVDMCTECAISVDYVINMFHSSMIDLSNEEYDVKYKELVQEALKEKTLDKSV
jgi:hypothetical protein